MATTMGLGARAMNLPITIAESNAGLVPPAVASMLMGPGGAFLLVFQVGERGKGVKSPHSMQSHSQPCQSMVAGHGP